MNGNNSNKDNNEILLDVRDLKEHFAIPSGMKTLKLKAVDGVTFSI